jgi:hypothetical protein
MRKKTPDALAVVRPLPRKIRPSVRAIVDAANGADVRALYELIGFAQGKMARCPRFPVKVPEEFTMYRQEIVELVHLLELTADAGLADVLIQARTLAKEHPRCPRAPAGNVLSFSKRDQNP